MGRKNVLWKNETEVTIVVEKLKIRQFFCLVTEKLNSILYNNKKRKIMRIFDLTNGKYACTKNLIADQIEDLVLGKMEKLKYPNDGFLYKRFSNNLWQHNLQTILQEVPVFLVDTGMSCKMTLVPGTETSVYVPKDAWGVWIEEVTKDGIEDWFRDIKRKMEEEEDRGRQNVEKSQEEEENGNRDNNPTRDRLKKMPVFTIHDRLAVYHHTSEIDLCPRRIFVWVDKIERSADTPSSAEVLLRNVVLHELGHAVMDTTLYEVIPSKYFSYKDDVYKFIEEAMANAFALMIDYDNYNSDHKKFIENFIKREGFGYSEGWNLYSRNKNLFGEIFTTWMSIKVIFKLAVDKLYDFWRNYDWIYFSACIVEGISLFYKKGTKMGQVEQPIHLILDNSQSNKLIPFSDDENKTWGLIDNTGKVCVPAKYEEIKLDSNLKGGRFWGRTGNKWGLTDTKDNLLTSFEYDFVWSFNDGLCMVKKGSLYGMVNVFGHDQIPVEYDYLYNFYKDRTIAKYKGQYYIIDDENNRLVDLSMKDTWKDIRGFNKKGFAPAQNAMGLWGVIDYDGNIVTPCTNKDMPKL